MVDRNEKGYLGHDITRSPMPRLIRQIFIFGVITPIRCYCSAILADAGGGGPHLRLLRRVYIRVAMHTRDADDAECGMRRDTGPYAARQLPRGKDVSNQPGSLIRIADSPASPLFSGYYENGTRSMLARVPFGWNFGILLFHWILYVSLRNINVDIEVFFFLCFKSSS